jgi:GT2 family glycosyltransferase
LRLAGWSIRAVPAARVVHRHAATSDRRSELFHFHNERNRLFTLLRCAPCSVAATQISRFALTTGSLALARALRRPIPDEQNFRVRLRLRVLAAALRRVPGAAVRRRGTRVTRRAVARTARTPAPGPVA